jgi:DNA-binding CsgD family transcriptional regulator
VESLTIRVIVDDQLEQFSRVVGAVYQAALDVSSWDDALLLFIETYAPLYWDVAFLAWEQAPDPGARFVAAASVAPHARELYAAHFAGRNPWSRRIASQPIGIVIDTDEICPREELYGSELYQMFLSKWSLKRALAVVLDKNGAERLALVIAGPEGQDVEGLARGLRLLAPHLQRAVRISHTIATAQLRAGAAEVSLAMDPSGVVALNANLGIVNANPRARTLIDGTTIALRQGKWTFADRHAQAQLSSLVASTHDHSVAFNITNSAGETLSVLGVRIQTQVAGTLDGFLTGASILLTITGQSYTPMIPLNHLTAWYGLTPTEAVLAAALAQGETISAFAVRRGVTENAVRFVLKGVLRKVEAPDQARLVVALKTLPLRDLEPGT